MTLPLVYTAFGFFATEKHAVVMELVFGVPFLCGAILALKFKAKWCLTLLAAFWLAHAGYDIFHDQWLINSGVLAWYPAFCAAVDVTIGAYLLYLLYLASKRVKPSNISASQV